MRLAVLMSFSGAGGVERMVMNLVREFAKIADDPKDDRLSAVDLLIIRAKGPYLQDIPENVRVIKLSAKHTLTAIPELVKYFRSDAPDVLLAAKDRAGRAAIRAKSLSGAKTRVCIRLGTNLSTALEHRSGFNRWLRKAPMKRIYSKADAVIAVSDGVNKDTQTITGMPSDKIHTIRNPVVTEAYLKAVGSEPPHPWLSQAELSQVPVIMGVGRLSQQKDFKCLIKAFSIVNKNLAARLIILGEGGLRGELEALVSALNISDCVLMPGFQTTPQQWVARASVFVLSSRWEGSPNVLTEALALGTPSVSTRCPSGPDEVLNNGEYGPLVNVGDYENLAKQIQVVLAEPLPAEKLKAAVVDYHAPISAEHYLKVLLGDLPCAV